jgi:hypothetical protein
MVLPNSHRVPRAPQYLGSRHGKPDPFHLQDCHLLRSTVPGSSAKNQVCNFPIRPTAGSRRAPRPQAHNACRAITCTRFGLFPVRSPLLRKSLLFSSPGGTEMFQFPPFASAAYFIQPRMSGHYPGRVSPFRNPRINACLAAPRGLSQLATSFIASWRQGIHRLPLLA